ncbi:hypothetical protein [Paenibacillus sp. IHBB 10380]|uniref:hypothetical protein n=1 Tax=Paenibacillus sp. IHBB 10380 TaxID=1566358 RepID=UPI0005CFA629|nr:hypothetical protein [Paenibacillus sp. IHBB 10380]AJS61058.1 hypothetical protein UB51_24390 [Paenibacillus sp. IHBB 10380]
MTEMAEITMDIRPGMLNGTITNSFNSMIEERMSYNVNILVAPISIVTKEDILVGLNSVPQDLYCLLRGSVVPWIEELLPTAVELVMLPATCSCEEASCRHVEEVREHAQQSLSADPMQRLTLMGLTRKEILAAVFGSWASRMSAQEQDIAVIEASLIQEKGRSGPSPGEWVSESVEQGRLHEPGPIFQSITLRLSPVQDDKFVPDDWTPLLQETTGVTKVLRMVMKKASDNAEKLRRKWVE